MNLYSFPHIIFCHLFSLLPFQSGRLFCLLPDLLPPLYLRRHGAPSSEWPSLSTCLCFSIAPLSSLFSQHLSELTILHSPVSSHVCSEAGEFPRQWGEGLCQFSRVGPSLHNGSAPHTEESHQGFRSPPKKAPPLQGGKG